MQPQRPTREVQGRHRLIPRHGWKIVEEVIEAITRLEIVEQGLYWNTGAGEDRGAAKDLRVCLYHRSLAVHWVILEPHTTPLATWFHARLTGVGPS